MKKEATPSRVQGVRIDEVTLQRLERLIKSMNAGGCKTNKNKIINLAIQNFLIGHGVK